MMRPSRAKSEGCLLARVRLHLFMWSADRQLSLIFSRHFANAEGLQPTNDARRHADSSVLLRWVVT